MRRQANRRPHGIMAGVIFGCLVGATMAFGIPVPGLAAGWLAPGADQTVRAPWVKDILTRLGEEPYRDAFVNASSEPPHSAIVRYLNGAAEALTTGNQPLAQSYVDLTIGIFDNGVKRGYYSRADAEAIKKMIQTRADAAMKGEQVASTVQADDRWTATRSRSDWGSSMNHRER
jgi:hypothetical protein